MVLALDWLALLAWLGIIAASLLTLHLVATWMEGRGWVYYRKRGGKGYGQAMSNAMAEFESILNPAAEHRVVEERHEDGRRDVVDSGETGPDEET